MQSNKLTLMAGRATALAQKHSPDILFALGLSGMIGSAVLAGKASTKFEETKAHTQGIIDADIFQLEDERAAGKIDDVQFKKGLGLTYIEAGTIWAKLYGPAFILGLASATALTTGHIQSRKRLSSALAAYGVLERGYSAYRNRVVEKLGQEQDDEFRFGFPEKRSYKSVDESGKKKTVKHNWHPEQADKSALFDEFNLNWRNDPGLNLYFLKAEQAHLNDLLNSRGHVFLNEVWDALGIQRTPMGALTGWVKGREDGVTSVIDLGLYETRNQAFIDGHEASCMIDPNIMGTVWDLL